MNEELLALLQAEEERRLAGNRVPVLPRGFAPDALRAPLRRKLPEQKPIQHSIRAVPEDNLIMRGLDRYAPGVHDAIRGGLRSVRNALPAEHSPAVKLALAMGADDPLSNIEGPLGAMAALAKTARALPDAARMARAKKMGFDTSQRVYHGSVEDIKAFDPERVGTSGESYGGHKAYWFADDPKIADDYASIAPAEVRQAGVDATDARNALDDRTEALRDQYWGREQGPLDPNDADDLEMLENDLDRAREEIDDAMSAWKNSEAGKAGITPGANITPAHLRMKKPLEVDAGGKRFNRVMPDILARAKAGKHDGIVVHNVVDPAGPASDFPTTIRAVFDPKNIRSTFAKFKKSKSADLLASTALPIAGAATLAARKEDKPK